MPDTESEVVLLSDYLKMVTKQAELKSKIKSAAASLDLMALRKYGDLSEADVKVLAIREKWFKAIESAIEMEINGLQSVLFERIKIVSERYDNKLSDILLKIKSLEHEVEKHLIHFLK